MIAGYTIANDLTVRDWQLRTPTMTLGKSFDTHHAKSMTTAHPVRRDDRHVHQPMEV